MINDFVNTNNEILTNNKLNIKNNKIYEKEFIKYNKITKLNIDSSDRIKIPKNILSDNFKIKSNGLVFTENSNLLKIKSLHKIELNINDRITIQNVTGNIYNMKGGIEFKKNDYFVKINLLNHNIDPKEVENNNFIIEIQNAYGNVNNGNYYNNISLSLINKTHIVYLTNNENNNINNNFFYIKIDNFPNDNFIDTTSNIKIIFKTIAGININEINSNYPININQINGYLTIHSIIDDFTLNVNLNRIAVINKNNIGGNDIILNKIIKYIPAYLKPNFYVINLNKTFENITKIKLISTEFPNTEKVIKDYPSPEQNNLLYLQVIEDGDYIYKISISEGNYSIVGISNEIKSKIESLKRVNQNENNNIQKSENFSAIVNINNYTDQFSLSLFSVISLSKVITVSQQILPEGNKIINLNHLNHNLQEGDTIQIQNAISTNSIPSNIINTSHIIYKVIDKNNYSLKLPLFNDSNENRNTGGGNSVNILIPITFRLLFNRDNTIGEILGFRNVGEENSITIFDKVISNNISYEFDYFKDSTGNEIYYDINTKKINNNSILLSGFNYILMCCNVFNNYDAFSTNNTNNIFAKLLLSDAPGSILFNQFIQLADKFENKIKTLSELEFSFFTPKGNLYDFQGIDHSFTIEINQEIIKFIEKAKFSIEENYNEQDLKKIEDFKKDSIKYIQ